MKRKLLILFAVLALLVLIPAAAFADTGPKPSVNITFSGLSGETCYAALLSATETTGPWSVGEYEEWYGDRDIWDAFKSYSDADGYYFLNQFDRVSDSDRFVWGYYPPTRFKLLLYFPESGEFAISEKLEAYAFDSYFSMSVSNRAIVSAAKSYDYSAEIWGFAGRAAATILVELGIALLIRLREKRQLLIILGVNIVTQVCLNALLNLAVYRNGPGLFYIIPLYIALEIAVLLIEGFAYALLLRGLRRSRLWLYSAAANAASFAAGLLLAFVLPGMF